MSLFGCYDLFAKHHSSAFSSVGAQCAPPIIPLISHGKLPLSLHYGPYIPFPRHTYHSDTSLSDSNSSSPFHHSISDWYSTCSDSSVLNCRFCSAPSSLISPDDRFTRSDFSEQCDTHSSYHPDCTCVNKHSVMSLSWGCERGSNDSASFVSSSADSKMYIELNRFRGTKIPTLQTRSCGPVDVSRSRFTFESFPRSFSSNMIEEKNFLSHGVKNGSCERLCEGFLHENMIEESKKLLERCLNPGSLKSTPYSHRSLVTSFRHEPCKPRNCVDERLTSSCVTSKSSNHVLSSANAATTLRMDCLPTSHSSAMILPNTCRMFHMSSCFGVLRLNQHSTKFESSTSIHISCALAAIAFIIRVIEWFISCFQF
ncbi:hypothetical protein AB6A40_002311 [Gnathostoma spinigerum]|uniref:Uncharacterized protein n=1 Tax=Gnathostoma spinigerum TaxID=75299 RepID=A0ABD6EFY7_9BILA